MGVVGRLIYPKRDLCPMPKIPGARQHSSAQRHTQQLMHMNMYEHGESEVINRGWPLESRPQASKPTKGTTKHHTRHSNNANT